MNGERGSSLRLELPPQGRKENIMGKRGDRLLQENNKVRELLYGNQYPCKITDCQYKDYISDNKDNDAVLDSMLSGQGIKLMIAPTGSGKTSALIARADRLVSGNRGYRVVFDLPTRALATQMGNNRAVRTMVGGDSFDEKSHIIATTYEKMYEVEDHIMNQRVQGNTERNVLVLDESHLLTTQHTFRKDAIQAVIGCIERNDFHSVILVTATPEPSSLYHFDEIVEFGSSDSAPIIGRLEIIEVDDPVEYIKGIDYSREFPFIRLNNTNEIDGLMAQVPQTFARLTKDDRQTKTYQDIVRHGRIDGSGIDGILATSVIEAGVSITDYPDNIVPMAVFPDNNISADDIEQFLNRIRAKGNKKVEVARVIVRKPGQKEIKASLVPYHGGRECICEFQDIHMEMGNLSIEDTGLMDAVADGKYRIHFEIGGTCFDRYITVSSSGVTCEKLYSKKNPAPITFEGIGFRGFFDILKYNYAQRERLSDCIKMLEQFWEEKRQALNLGDDEMEREKIRNDMFISQLANGYIRQAGEIDGCLSLVGNEVFIDKRICFEVSYHQYNRQYYHNHDILAEELRFRLGADVVLLEQDTSKGKKAPCNKEDIWDGIDDLRKEIEGNRNDTFWSYLMGKNGMYFYLYSKKDTVNRVREQVHLMEILNEMEKQGITGGTALSILTSSRSQKKIKEYVKCFHGIAFNKQLEQCDGMDIGQILNLCYKGRKKEMALQAVIYCCLEQKGVQSPMVTKELEKDIQEYYGQVFADTAKLPTVKSIGNKVRQMYKSRGKNRIDKVLRTNMSDIFTLVKPDYK